MDISVLDSGGINSSSLRSSYLHSVQIGNSNTRELNDQPNNPFPNVVREFVMSLLPNYFPKDVKKLIMDMYLISMQPIGIGNTISIGHLTTIEKSNSCYVLGEDSHCYLSHHVMIVGPKVYCIGCSNCIIQKVGDEPKVYLGYHKRIFQDI